MRQSRENDGQRKRGKLKSRCEHKKHEHKNDDQVIYYKKELIKRILKNLPKNEESMQIQFYNRLSIKFQKFQID